MPSTLLIRRLYRSLLKAAQPFTTPHASRAVSPVVLNCLLHRTGVEDESWVEFLRGGSAAPPKRIVVQDDDDEGDTAVATLDELEEENDEDTAASARTTESKEEREMALFRRLLRDAMCGRTSDTDDDVTGQKRMQFPVHVDTGRLRHVIRKEFRRPLEANDDLSMRQSVAFRALRELNKKLAFAAEREAKLLRPASRGQAARHVAPLPLYPPKSYLRPGTFLLAHPNMTGYFQRSVICILDHRSEDDEDEDEEEEVVHSPEPEASAPEEPPVASASTEQTMASASTEQAMASDASESETTTTTTSIPLSKRERPKRSSRMKPSYGTYGLIVNRVSVSPHSGKTLTLTDILRPLPAGVVKTFGRHPVREGGPVHMALQMIYQVSSTQQEQYSEEEAANFQLGGTILPPIHLTDDATSVAADSDKAVYFRGSILNAMRAVDAGRVDREDISFFVGASCWSVGQLEKEMEHGFWLPCRGPTTLAQSGICEHDIAPDDVRPEADLWLSMMSACGPDEAQLAYLLHRDDGKNPNGAACDS